MVFLKMVSLGKGTLILTHHKQPNLGNETGADVHLAIESAAWPSTLIDFTANFFSDQEESFFDIKCIDGHWVLKNKLSTWS